MPVRIDETNPEQKVCFFTVEHGEEIRLCSDLTVITDTDKAMSAVDIEGQRIYLTEAEVNALTVAGAKDGREHVKADTGDSVV